MAIKGAFCRLPLPYTDLLSTPPPTTTKNKTAYVHFTGYHSRPTDELDTLSDSLSSSLPNSATNTPPCPYPATIRKKKLCIVLELFCLVNNFMIWKRKRKKKKKKKEKKKEKKLQMMVARFEPGTYGLRNSRLTTKLPKPTAFMYAYVTKYVFIFNMASRTIRPSTCAIPQFQFWLKKPYQMHNKSGECLEIIILSI